MLALHGELELAVVVAVGPPADAHFDRIAELVGIVAEAGEFAAEVNGGQRQYVSLLKEPAGSGVAKQLASRAADGEHVRVCGRAVHMILEQESYQQATLTNDLVERQAGVATNRNISVLRELASRWC